MWFPGDVLYLDWQQASAENPEHAYPQVKVPLRHPYPPEMALQYQQQRPQNMHWEVLKSSPSLMIESLRQRLASIQTNLHPQNEPVSHHNPIEKNQTPAMGNPQQYPLNSIHSDEFNDSRQRNLGKSKQRETLKKRKCISPQGKSPSRQHVFKQRNMFLS